MSTFKTLPVSLIHRLLEHETDVLSDRDARRQEMIKKIPCKRCGDPLCAVPDPERPFRTGEVLPALLAKCQVCGYTVDVQSGLVVDTGNPSAERPRDPIHIFNNEPE